MYVKYSPLSSMSTKHIHEIKKFTITNYVNITHTGDLKIHQYQLCRHNTYTRMKNSPLPIMSTYHIHKIENFTSTNYVDIIEYVHLF